MQSKEDMGYFYTENINYIIDDLYLVTEYIKFRYRRLPLFLFSHSMGTLAARGYLKKHDTEADKLVLCRPPTKNNMAATGLFLARLMKLFVKDKSAAKIFGYAHL